MRVLPTVGKGDRGLSAGEITLAFYEGHTVGLSMRHPFEFLLKNLRILEARTDRTEEDERTLREVKDAVARIRERGYHR